MKKIILISGDPNSINSEIIFKSLNKINKNVKKKIYLISNYNLIKSQLKKLKLNLKLSSVKSIDDKVNDDGIKIININLNFTNSFNVNINEASNFVLKVLI